MRFIGLTLVASVLSLACGNDASTSGPADATVDAPVKLDAAHPTDDGQAFNDGGAPIDADVSPDVGAPVLCDGGGYFLEVSDEAGTMMLKGRSGDLTQPPYEYCGYGLGEDCFAAAHISGASPSERAEIIAFGCQCAPLGIGFYDMEMADQQDSGLAWAGLSKVRITSVDSTVIAGDYQAKLVLKDGGMMRDIHGKLCISPQ